MNSIAYLDISPRQTGKTSRLVKLAIKLALERHTVIFVARPGMIPQLRQELAWCQVTVLTDGDPVPRGINPDKAIWFYDEFDWLESTQHREGGYYATTPKFQRKLGEHTPKNDLLLRLLQANGERFERHYWPFDMGDTLQQARECHSPAEFRLLYLGEFLA